MEKPLEFDRNRIRVKQCPCGKSNKNGKFCPFKGYSDRGKCFSCDRMFWPESDPGIFQPYTKRIQPRKRPSFMNFESVMSSCQDYRGNTLATWMVEILGEDDARKVFEMYYLGTSTKWNGSSVFWQIDVDGKVRGGKLMAYDDSGHRIKKPKALITWMHSHLNFKDYNLQQCFFGEHLLMLNPSMDVCIVESEKTAMICAAYVPNCIWLATGGKSGCNFSLKSVNHVLKGRDVYLEPDQGAYDLWLEKSKTIPARLIKVSDRMEHHFQGDKYFSGLDLADFLLTKPLSFYRDHPPIHKDWLSRDIFDWLWRGVRVNSELADDLPF